MIDESSPFHPGEKAIQSLVGARDVSEALGRSWHSDKLSPITATFLTRHSLLYFTSRDSEGNIWASALVGKTGFVSSPDDGHLCVSPLRKIHGDPARLEVGNYIGTTAVVLETRQRARVNGKIESLSQDELNIAVQNSFFSCPKFIQARRLDLLSEELERIDESRPVHKGGHELGPAERDLIERADTFFIATGYEGPLPDGDGHAGLDISHRGGFPGFVRVDGPGTLKWPDYLGNLTFTTLGNLMEDPRAGIFLMDFATGTTLHLSGRACILFDDHELPGAERSIEFVTERWVRIEGALPVRAPGPVDFSPFNPRGPYQYSETLVKERIKQLHNNYVSGDALVEYLACVDVRQESWNVKTYTFQAPREGFVRFSFKAGQYGTFDFEGIEDSTLTRSWTLSCHPDETARTNTISITVKRVGKASVWLWDNMGQLRTIAFRGLDGIFTSDVVPSEGGAQKVLLIAGGIGITPMRPMFLDFLKRGVDVMLLYCVRSLDDAVFLSELAEKAQERSEGDGAPVRIHVNVTGDGACAFDSTNSCAAKATDRFWVGCKGRLTASQMKKVVPDLEQRIAFLCGPAAMMEDMTEALANLNFPMHNLHTESFLF
ncbi:probable 3-ketosteroid-9-alpha-monooxygenase, ferredoxin reductase at C-terminar half [Coccomyxa sp. Obi]|nr:probable 3-ketosteroid-9-alpha-monooxygenase, ferredoxin reductase at C-terminar half [Coccomyxa sp. Obi]